MPAAPPRRPSSPARLFPLLGLLALAPGCGLLFGGDPDKANIQLRKDKQGLQTRVGELEQKSGADAQQIAALRSAKPSVPTLPPDRLARLYTTHGVEFGRLTGGLDADPASPGDEGLAVYVAPTDDDGKPIKMAGAFVVEAFDLADQSNPLVGRWAFDLDAARRAWRGALFDYTYVLACPWQQRVPVRGDLTVKVEFLDELTQTPFRGQSVVKIKPPARPTTTAATQNAAK